MPRTIVIRIVVDNRDAVNAIKAQREEDARLRDSVKFTNEELRKQEAAANKLSDAHEKATNNTKNLTDSFIKGFLAARALSEIYGVVTNSIGSFLSQTANLELSLAKVAAVTGSSGESISRLEDTIYLLGRTTNASIGEIASAGLELAKLGFSGKELEIALAGVARLSGILGDSLETTGNLVGGVIKTFDLSADQAATVADKLFVATGKSAANIEGFRIAFGLAGNVANTAGISFEELSAAISALSNQGIRASTIGTGLRNFIGELSKEGSKAQKALGGSIEELGLLGAMKKLSEIKPDAGSIIQIFGKPGAPVATAFEHITGEYLDALNQINNAQGKLADGSVLVNNTLIGSITELKNSLVELFSVFEKGPGQKFATVIRYLAEGAQLYSDEGKNQAGLDDLIKRKGIPQAASDLGLKGKNFTDEDMLNAFIERQKRDKVALDDALFEAKQLKAQEDLKAGRGVDNSKDFLKTDNGPNTKDLLKQIEDITIAFERFQVGRNDAFNFSTAEKQLLSIADSFKTIKDGKNELRAINELRTVKGADDRLQKKDAKAKEQEDKNLIEFDKATDKYQKEQVDNVNELDRATDKYFKKQKDLYTFLQNRKDENDNFNQSLELTKILFDGLTNASDAFASQFVKNIFDGKNAFHDFGSVIKSVAADFIKQLIAMELRFLAFKAVIGIFGAATGGAGAFAGEFATTIASNEIPKFANGYDGVVSKPHLFIAGEAGAERVTVTPLGKGGGSGMGGEGITIHVHGDIYNAEKLVDKIAQTNERSKTRYV